MEVDLHYLHALFESEEIVQSRGHTTGHIGESGPPGLRSTWVPLLVSLPLRLVELGIVSLTKTELTESELAVKLNLLGVNCTRPRYPSSHSLLEAFPPNLVNLGLRLSPCKIRPRMMMVRGRRKQQNQAKSMRRSTL